MSTKKSKFNHELLQIIKHLTKFFYKPYSKKFLKYTSYLPDEMTKYSNYLYFVIFFHRFYINEIITINENSKNRTAIRRKPTSGGGVTTLSSSNKRRRTMVIRGIPSLRGSLGACFILGLYSGFVMSCGDPQAPSFQTKFLATEKAVGFDDQGMQSADVAVASAEKIDEEKIKIRAQELGIESEPDDLMRGQSKTRKEVRKTAVDNGPIESKQKNEQSLEYEHSPTGSEPTPQLPSDAVPDYASEPSQGSGKSEIPANYEKFSQSIIQPVIKPVDILWVIDSSGSMAEEQNYLAQNFQALAAQLIDAGTNFQTAVTTTDMCESDGSYSERCPVAYGGTPETRLQGSFFDVDSVQVLKSSDPSMLQKFADLTKVGTEGSGFEHGLEAAEHAIRKSIDGRNQSLIRDESFLSIIVVSDEEDDGIGLRQPDGFTGINYLERGFTSHAYTHENLINFLKEVKGNGNFAISAVTGTLEASGSLCQSAHSKPFEQGVQYIRAANASGGIVQSICETDWQNSLGLIGQDIKAQITQVKLDKTPHIRSLRVVVNDIESVNWSYLKSTNTVKFDRDNIPRPGSIITIDYYAMP